MNRWSQIEISWGRCHQIRANISHIGLNLSIYLSISWSTEAVEYADSISKTSPPIRILDMTLKHLMLRFQSWSFGEYGRLRHYHYSPVHSYLEWLYLLGSHQCVKRNYLFIYYTKKHLTVCKQMIDV